ncbi:MAG: hypothetical protein KGL39_35150 [Patescibacteria group bacterium]|nr:hypothetical protein [Patescibacteria group bacterium]
MGTYSGSQTPSPVDLYGFLELYGGRQYYSYSGPYQGQTAQIAASYLTTQAVGNLTEAMLLDTPTGSATMGSSTIVGATTLPMAAGAPAVTGNTQPGQYTVIYINDATNPEYAYIKTSAIAGAASWTLQSGLVYAHATSTPVVVFNGNLWAHSTISLNKLNTEQATIQWSIPFTPQ